MKKVIFLLICFVILITAASCSFITPKTTASESTGSPESSVLATTEKPATTVPTTTNAPTTTAAPTTSGTGTGVSPTNTAVMYSSYALMVSFDPARGWADFDYFDMLRGDVAIQWLVDHEGYTLANAQNEVNNFSDSEFVLKNVNPQLRTIDLRNIPLKLMYYSDGTMIEGATPVDAELIDLYNLYTLNPKLVLAPDAPFYHITVVGTEVTLVEQVYWP